MTVSRHRNRAPVDPVIRRRLERDRTVCARPVECVSAGCSRGADRAAPGRSISGGCPGRGVTWLSTGFLGCPSVGTLGKRAKHTAVAVVGTWRRWLSRGLASHEGRALNSPVPASRGDVWACCQRPYPAGTPIVWDSTAGGWVLHAHRSRTSRLISRKSRDWPAGQQGRDGVWSVEQRAEVEPVRRFLRQVTGFGSNTPAAYGHDPRYLFGFLVEDDLDWRAPPAAPAD